MMYKGDAMGLLFNEKDPQKALELFNLYFVPHKDINHLAILVTKEQLEEALKNPKDGTVTLTLSTDEAQTILDQHEQRSKLGKI